MCKKMSHLRWLSSSKSYIYLELHRLWFLNDQQYGTFRTWLLLTLKQPLITSLQSALALRYPLMQ